MLLIFYKQHEKILNKKKAPVVQQAKIPCLYHGDPGANPGGGVGTK